MSPNPEAIAWYVQRSERVLDDLHDGVRSLRTRGAQLAGFDGAVLAVAGANAEGVIGALHGFARTCAGGSLLAGLVLLVLSLTTALRGTLLTQGKVDVSADEVANFVTRRFADEPDLWRVHVRTIHGLLASIGLMRQQIDLTERALRAAGRFLFAVGNALGILILVVTL